MPTLCECPPPPPTCRVIHEYVLEAHMDHVSTSGSHIHVEYHHGDGSGEYETFLPARLAIGGFWHIREGFWRGDPGSIVSRAWQFILGHDNKYLRGFVWEYADCTDTEVRAQVDAQIARRRAGNADNRGFIPWQDTCLFWPEGGSVPSCPPPSAAVFVPAPAPTAFVPPTVVRPTAFVPPTVVRPVPTSSRQGSAEGYLYLRTSYCGNAVLANYELVDCDGNHFLLQCDFCDPAIGDWVIIDDGNVIDCSLGGQALLADRIRIDSGHRCGGAATAVPTYRPPRPAPTMAPYPPWQPTRVIPTPMVPPTDSPRPPATSVPAPVACNSLSPEDGQVVTTSDGFSVPDGQWAQVEFYFLSEGVTEWTRLVKGSFVSGPLNRLAGAKVWLYPDPPCSQERIEREHVAPHFEGRRAEGKNPVWADERTKLPDGKTGADVWTRLLTR